MLNGKIIAADTLYVGPYTIVKQLDPCNVAIRQNRCTRILVVHRDKLRPAARAKRASSGDSRDDKRVDPELGSVANNDVGNGEEDVLTGHGPGPTDHRKFRMPNGKMGTSRPIVYTLKNGLGVRPGAPPVLRILSLVFTTTAQCCRYATRWSGRSGRSMHAGYAIRCAPASSLTTSTLIRSPFMATPRQNPNLVVPPPPARQTL